MYQPSVLKGVHTDVFLRELESLLGRQLQYIRQIMYQFFARENSDEVWAKFDNSYTIECRRLSAFVRAAEAVGGGAYW